MEPPFLVSMWVTALLLAAFTCSIANPRLNTISAPLVLEERSGWTVGQIVNTTSGPVQGTASTLRSDVSAYLGIPFAQPPTGDLRFAAPVPVARASNVIDATRIGPDCPCNLIPIQHALTFPSGGTDCLVAVSQHGDVLSEDCLSVNVWTKPQTGESTKAVLFWVFGGGFSIGNAANKVYDGSILADENDVVVVSANYRTNIFGFSGAPGVTQNVGLLDQRLAMEWARDNVQAFGGDPCRITLFGQSAGGASVDYITYAYPDDPIANGIIAQSGVANAVFASGSSTTVTNNWYNVSESLGCGGEEAGAATITCMREQGTQDILNALTKISNVSISSGFTPVVDNITLPADITTRLSNGDFAKIPLLAGNTDYEGGFFLALWLAYTNVTEQQIAAQPQWFFSLIQAVLDAATPIAFTCSVIEAVSGRASNCVPAWKYTFYGGNYSNIYLPFVGSDYHTSELPVLFGTAPSVTNISDSPPEASQSRNMRRAWAAFARDPQHGLSHEMGWPTYSNITPQVVRIAYDNETRPSTVIDCSTPALCAKVTGFQDIATAFVNAISPYESFLPSNFLEDILNGVQGNPSNGSTVDILLSILEFFVSSLI